MEAGDRSWPELAQGLADGLSQSLASALDRELIAHARRLLDVRREPSAAADALPAHAAAAALCSDLRKRALIAAAN